ncbi:ead/Ea22-like family protein [Escherichia coli]|nr:ead/Ea22-like family protein [Escherichia coli]
MSEINYQALREAAEKATPGNWWIDSHGHAMVSFVGNDVLEVFTTDNKRAAVRHEDTGNLSRWRNDNDATFIATADPATVLALLDELEAAEKRIAELESGSQAQKLVEAIIVAIENEQERLFDEDYLMDSKECIDVIREEVKRWNDSRAAGIRIKGDAGEQNDEKP